jgi:ABC-type sugar transport system permease subunit
LQLPAASLVGYTLVKRSIDARRRGAIQVVYCLDLELTLQEKDERRLRRRFAGDPHLRPTPDHSYHFVAQAPAPAPAGSLPPVVVGMVAVVVLDPSFGVANWVLAQFGIPPSLWLAHPKWVLFTVALLDTWQAAPFVALIVLGGLLSLPAKVFEAAEVDGAVGWRRFVYITLPLLGPTLLTAAILRSVDLLRFFDIIYITTRGGPGNASTTLNIYAYQQAFEFTRFGYASAAMVTLSSVVFGTVLVFAKLRKTVAW